MAPKCPYSLLVGGCPSTCIINNQYHSATRGPTPTLTDRMMDHGVCRPLFYLSYVAPPTCLHSLHVYPYIPTCITHTELAAQKCNLLWRATGSWPKLEASLLHQGLNQNARENTETAHALQLLIALLTSTGRHATRSIQHRWMINRAQSWALCLQQ